MSTLEKINSIARDLFSTKPADNDMPLASLGMDSLDLVEFVMAVEEEFGGLEIPDAAASAWVTVGDVVEFVEGERK